MTKERVIAEIDKLFSNTKVAKSKTKDDLENIRDHVDILIESLGDDEEIDEE